MLLLSQIRKKLTGTRENSAASMAAPFRAPGFGEAVTEGDHARDAQDWLVAARHYRTALDLDAERPDIWVQYGHALKESGELAQAEEAYRRALVIDAGNADTYLQLGHVLKMQRRATRAGKAYLRALQLNPALQHAREELAHLGWSTSAINRGLFAREASAVDAAPASSVRGTVLAVGTDYVEGRVENVRYDDLPLTVICTNAEAVVAETTMTRPEGEEVVQLSSSLPFRLTLPPIVLQDEQSALRLFIEPGAIELRNSPFLPLGGAGIDLLLRIERLESQLAASLDQDETMRRFATNLSETLYETAVSRIDAIIEHQRRMFERQLLRLVGGAPPPPELLPERIELRADDNFAGYGWFPPEASASGERHRWMGERGFLTYRLGGEHDLLMLVDIHEAMMAHLPSGLLVTINGVPLRRWVERRHPEGWRLSAALPASLKHEDGTIGIAIASDEAVFASTRDPRRLSVSVSWLRLRPMPSLSVGEFLIDADSEALVHGWLGRYGPPDRLPARLVTARGTVLLPRIETRATAMLTVVGYEAETGAPVQVPELILNGSALAADTDRNKGGWRISAAVDPAVWRPAHPNILELVSTSSAEMAGWAMEVIRLQLPA